jgi:tetratricopeptide (TPR) repeat protein
MISGPMKKSPLIGRSAALALSLFALSAPALHAQAEGSRLVLQTGRSLPLANVAFEGGKFVVKTASDSFAAGNSFPLSAASHVSGEKPVAINRGTALLLLEDPAKALEQLEPVVASHRVTAQVPGNYWLEAARSAVLAYSLYNEPAKAEALGKEIADATADPGADPVVKLGQALALPLTVKFDDRLKALTSLVSDSNPEEINAFASYFAAKLLKKVDRNDEALDNYLSVGCLYPAGGLILTSAAEMNAAELIKMKPDRREEALSLLSSAARGSKGTALGVAANKALEGLK